MHPQRWLLLVALILSLGYVWLRGGFVGLGQAAVGPRSGVAAAPAPASPDVGGRVAAPLEVGLARATFHPGAGLWALGAWLRARLGR